MAECGKYVGSGAVAYPCNVEVVGGQPHLGPCSARENIKSVGARKRWETENPQATAPAPPPQAAVPDPRAERDNLPTDRPVTVADLGMQGPPKSAVDGMLALEGREGRRLHPSEQARQEQLVINGEEDVVGIEEALSRSAGGVKISEAGEGPPPNYAALTELDDEVEVSWKTVSEDEAQEILASGLKNRPEDQPLPVVHDDQPCIQDLLIEDIGERKRVGISRYDTALQPFNGRNVDQDLYEELLDASTYMRQRLFERETAGLWLYELTTVLEELFPRGVPEDVLTLLVKLSSFVVIPE